MGKRKQRDQSKSVSAQSSKRQPLSPKQVQSELMEGVTVETLIALGVLTQKGGASPSARRKVKQVNHLLKQMSSALSDIFNRYDDPIIVDMGAGRATVSLALYDRWIRAHGKGQLIAIESRPELVQKVKQATQDNYPRFHMIEGSALKVELPKRVHLVLGLHACDLATDYAIARGITHKADYFSLVPCCQAEFAQALKQSQRKDALSNLWSSAHHRREFGAHLTNVVRTQVLKSVGYAVTVTELTGWEHSMKNELILGRRVGRYHEQSKTDLNHLLQEAGLLGTEGEHLEHSPWLIKELPKLIAQRDEVQPNQDTQQQDAQQQDTQQQSAKQVDNS